MGIGTWYKYANRLGVKRKFFRLNRKREIGIRTASPLQMLHMDVTIFKPLNQTKVYIYFIVDNFSRAILSWKASLEYSSANALGILKEAVQKYEIDNSTLITDGGPENHGEVSKFIEGTDDFKHVIAQKDIIQSNSMVEAVNNYIKYYYLFKKELKNIDELNNHLTHSVSNYNDKPHGKLNGFTPTEVVNGTDPSKFNFKNDISKAREMRLKQNQLTTCCQSE